MMLPLWWLEHLYRQARRYRRQKRNTHNAHGVEGKREEHLVRLREELEGRTDSPARAGCVVVKQPQFREIFAADFRNYVGHPG